MLKYVRSQSCQDHARFSQHVVTEYHCYLIYTPEILIPQLLLELTVTYVLIDFSTKDLISF
jgi:hypothetical protein